MAHLDWARTQNYRRAMDKQAHPEKYCLVKKCLRLRGVCTKHLQEGTVFEGKEPRKKQRKGFAVMDKEKVREIASMGGRIAHARGTAHEFDSAEASAAGRKGGLKVSRDREYMARIGRRGGEARGRNARNSDKPNRAAIEAEEQYEASKYAPESEVPATHETGCPVAHTAREQETFDLEEACE